MNMTPYKLHSKRDVNRRTLRFGTFFSVLCNDNFIAYKSVVTKTPEKQFSVKSSNGI